MEILSDFSGQRSAADAELMAARRLEGTRPGEAIRAYREVALKWPFEKEIRETALKRAGDLEKAAQQSVLALGTAVREFGVYRSADALHAMETLATDLEAKFLGDTAPEGTLETTLAELVAQVKTGRGEFEVELAMPGLDRLERLYTLLETATGYRPMAALYARAVIERYEHLENVAPDIARRIQVAREKLAELEKHEDVGAALPPKPQN